MLPTHKPLISVSYFTHMAGAGQDFKKLKPYSYDREYLIILIIDSSATAAVNRGFVLLKPIHKLHSENVSKCWQDRWPM